MSNGADIKGLKRQMHVVVQHGMDAMMEWCQQMAKETAAELLAAFAQPKYDPLREGFVSCMLGFRITCAYNQVGIERISFWLQNVHGVLMEFAMVFTHTRSEGGFVGYKSKFLAAIPCNPFDEMSEEKFDKHAARMGLPRRFTKDYLMYFLISLVMDVAKNPEKTRGSFTLYGAENSVSKRYFGSTPVLHCGETIEPVFGPPATLATVDFFARP